MKKSIATLALSLILASTTAAQTVETYLQGHTDSVNAVVYSPDGRRAVTASDDKTIKIWDTASGRLLQTLAGHGGGVFSLALSPDGKQIASGSDDNTIKIWNMETGQEIKSISHTQVLYPRLVISPDGKHISSPESDNTVKIWDINSGKELYTLSGHTRSVMAIAYSPDGKYIASGGRDRTIKIWDVGNGKEIKTIDTDSTVRNMVYSPDGKQIGYTSGSLSVKLLDVNTGKEIKAFSLSDDNILIWSLAYSRDGKQIIASCDNTIKIWGIQSGNEIRTFTGHTALINSVAYSPDNSCILSGSDDKTARIWDAATGRELMTLPAIPAPLTREILASYLETAGSGAKTSGPFAGSTLYKNTPRETALQFGLLVFKELAVARFLNTAAAVSKYEAMLTFITGRGNAARAEIEAFYRQNVGALVSAEVDAQFNRVEFMVDRKYDVVLTLNPKNGQYTIYYDRASVENDDKELSAPSLDALALKMRDSGDFTADAVNTVRAQAALMPALKLAPSEIAAVKEILADFYLSPGGFTYNRIRDVVAIYNIAMVSSGSNNAAYANAAGSYVNTISMLSGALGTRIVNDVIKNPVIVSPIAANRPKNVASLLELRQR